MGMKTANWFDRKFLFEETPPDYETIYSRLAAITNRLQEVCKEKTEQILEVKQEGKWSVKEHVGHLFILETLWQRRFIDISDGKPELTLTDLDNMATSQAGFNNYQLDDLIKRFDEERGKTLSLVGNLDMLDTTKKSLHPRLQQYFRLIDHACFIADHDDHHLEAIQQILLS